jgi:hypothetical protein
MQISIKCKHCGHQFIFDKEDELALEIDFSAEELRFVCREKGCRKNNVLNFAPRRLTQPLPGILAGGA